MKKLSGCFKSKVCNINIDDYKYVEVDNHSITFLIITLFVRKICRFREAGKKRLTTAFTGYIIK